MLVTRLVGCVDTVRFDCQGKSRLGGILPIERKLPLELVEPTMNLTDIQMHRIETDRGRQQGVRILLRS